MNPNKAQKDRLEKIRKYRTSALASDSYAMVLCLEGILLELMELNATLARAYPDMTVEEAVECEPLGPDWSHV
jgi:hypothetical protein